jgi:hypothetical protein
MALFAEYTRMSAIVVCDEKIGVGALELDDMLLLELLDPLLELDDTLLELLDFATLLLDGSSISLLISMFILFISS